jgi:hypothetical protein
MVTLLPPLGVVAEPAGAAGAGGGEGAAGVAHQGAVKPQIACGDHHTVALKADGSLWAWGYNHQGQLGDGTTVSRQVSPLVSCGRTWSTVIDVDFRRVEVSAGR